MCIYLNCQSLWYITFLKFQEATVFFRRCEQKQFWCHRYTWDAWEFVDPLVFNISNRQAYLSCFLVSLWVQFVYAWLLYLNIFSFGKYQENNFGVHHLPVTRERLHVRRDLTFSNFRAYKKTLRTIMCRKYWKKLSAASFPRLDKV